jgi:hypothetical protein
MPDIRDKLPCRTQAKEINKFNDPHLHQAPNTYILHIEDGACLKPVTYT